MNYPHLFNSESELSLLTLTSEGWSFPRAFSFISMACLKNASAGLQTTGKKKHYHLSLSHFQKHQQQIMIRNVPFRATIQMSTLICEQQQNKVISDQFIHVRSATTFEDPKWTFLKLFRNMFEIIACTDMWVIETFRLRRGRLRERDILNIKWCARVKQRLAGKRDGRRHSSTLCSENVVMTEQLNWYKFYYFDIRWGVNLLHKNDHNNFSGVSLLRRREKTASVANHVLASNLKVSSFF